MVSVSLFDATIISQNEASRISRKIQTELAEHNALKASLYVELQVSKLADASEVDTHCIRTRVTTILPSSDTHSLVKSMLDVLIHKIEEFQSQVFILIYKEFNAPNLESSD